MESIEVAGGWLAVEVSLLELSGEFVAVFEGLLGEGFAVLLDSAAPPGQVSVLAIGPQAVLSAWSSPLSAADGRADIELREWGSQRFGVEPTLRRYRADLFVELSRLLEAWSWPASLRAHLSLPFVSGAVGFVGYDAGRYLERLPETARRDTVLPDCCWLFVDAVVVHEHATGVTQLVVSGRGASAHEAEQACLQLTAAFRTRLDCAARGSGTTAGRPPRVGPVRAYADPHTYAATVRRAQQHVLAGDVFEVCTAHRLEADYEGSPWPLYRALREISPAAFACYVTTPWVTLLSSSPERFLSLDAERWAETRPIKGTRPRGATAAEDMRLCAELRDSEKDRAENIMIVDLARNDLGRVCEVDSVHVPELMIVEAHPRVFHMVSTVRGRLAADATAVQLFTACFPPGSMTGAPKIEAMKIIDALEPYRRAVYSGAVGYFDAGGGMDFSVVIRTFVLTGGRCYFSVGGAIVADSDPHAEYQETLDKARALLEALTQLSAAST